jgi:hypothetical protein
MNQASHDMEVEYLLKSELQADMLLTDLQELNRVGGPLVSLLILPEIEKVAEVKMRLKAMNAALKRHK